MELTANFGYHLLHVAAIAGRQADQLLQERLGIGLSQYKLLRIIEHRGEGVIRQRQLAKCLGQTEASISRQVKLLSEKSLIRTAINPKSRRDHQAELTEKGAKVLLASSEILQTYFQRIIADLDDKQQMQFVENLLQIHQSVCAAGKPFACDQSFKEITKQKKEM